MIWLLVLAATPAAAPSPDEDIVVTGYRTSLARAAQTKRADDAIVEVISAEDIADFPDLNLAEALQRLPGVTIDRDGGEGRTITVRGLSPDFTRVRINGLEALATTGGKDSASGAGGANRGRGSDFQVFPSELFDQVTVRKSASAEVEEGSLGATVDLAPALPFDRAGVHAAAGLQYGVNDLSRRRDPRATGLISATSANGRFGALLSAAYSRRRTIEEISSSGRWENPAVATNSAGCFETPGPCNAPPGSYSAVNAAWHPRIPRYGRLDYDSARLGVTGAVQFRPGAQTLLTLSGLYARVGGERRENYLEIYSLSRGGQGNPRTDVRAATIDARDQVIAGTFDDVDVRSEERHDVLSTRFAQGTLTIAQTLGTRWTIDAAIGQARSVQDNPVQTTVSLDRYDSDGYRYDFSGDQRRPRFDYAFDVTDPAAWQFSPSTRLGDASLIRLRPNRTTNRLRSARLDLAWRAAAHLTVKLGGLLKGYDFATSERRRSIVGGVTDGAVALPAGVTIADISHVVSGFGRNFAMPAGNPTRWLAPDLDRLTALLGIDCDCVNASGDFRLSSDNQRAANRDVRERDASAYLQVDLDTRLFDIALRGNAGVRLAHTATRAGGFVGAEFVRRSRGYDDVLPALNLVLEPRRDLLVRFAAARVMARPQLPFLTPGGTISNTARTLTIGNPALDPVRATTIDLNLEYYPGPTTQVTIGLFRKDLSSYVQTSSVTLPYGATGLPAGLLANGNTIDTVFDVLRYENTRGGRLQGIELAVQRPFDFLPAPLNRFGGIANVTRVRSSVAYITDAAATPPATRTLPLAGLSPTSWNATLYYETRRLGARVSAAYRSGYLAAVPGGNGNDARGKDGVLTVDANATLRLSDAASLVIEGLNLTDAFDNRWNSTERHNSEEYGHTGRQYYLGLRYRL